MLTPNFIDCRSIFRWIYLELVVCVWPDKLQKGTVWLLAVVNRFPTWYLTAFFWYDLAFYNLLISKACWYFVVTLFVCDFFCQSIDQIKVLKTTHNSVCMSWWKWQKNIIIHTSYSPVSSPSLCHRILQRIKKHMAIWLFFIFQVRQYLDRINAFSKRKSIICFINNTFSNRYCLMSSQYSGNVLILQTVF